MIDVEILPVNISRNTSTGPMSSAVATDDINVERSALPTAGRSRAGTVAVSSFGNVSGVSKFDETAKNVVVLSPPHLLSRSRRRSSTETAGKLRLKLHEDNILTQSNFDTGKIDTTESKDRPQSLELIVESVDVTPRTSYDDEYNDDGEGGDTSFEEADDVKERLDIMNECMANVNSLRNLLSERTTLHRNTLAAVEKELGRLAKGIGKKDIEQAAFYYRIFRERHSV